MDEERDEWMDKRMHGWLDGIDRWMMDGWMDG